MTDFRELCAELVDVFDNPSPPQYKADVLNRARAALAQPEPQGPTDEELLDLGNDLMGNCLPCDPDLLIAFARAVLARWGCQ